jgi:hypothetical protein
VSVAPLPTGVLARRTRPSQKRQKNWREEREDDEDREEEYPARQGGVGVAGIDTQKRRE